MFLTSSRGAEILPCFSYVFVERPPGVSTRRQPSLNNQRRRAVITEHAQALFDPMLRIKSGSVHDARREAEERMKKAPDFYIRG